MLLGAASGIGSAICARFASEGANLILVDRNQQKLRQTYKEITCNYGKDHLFDCGMCLLQILSKSFSLVLK